MSDALKRVVGIEYEPEQGLPRVVLKASGALAEEILKKRGVGKKPPIVRNDALLQQLYRLPIDGEIGPDLYRVVAMILVHVFAIEETMRGRKLIDAMSATANAMVNDMARLNAISHNLANSSTAGFKREILVSRPFFEYLGLAGMSHDAILLPVEMPQTQSVIDHKPGTLKFSGNPLDLAIQDGGYFEVMTERGVAYTRQGSFRLDAQGKLVTEAGLPVMGTAGELFISTTQPTINARGKVTDGEREIGSLKIVKFEDNKSLRHIGNGLYLADESAALATDGYDNVRQGFVETSNVNSMAEMVKLIETMRHFESSQRVIQSYGDMMDKTFRSLGEF